MPSSQSPIIDVSHLSATLGERQVLTDVSFRVYPNQVTVILGSSGCGKTTVLKHLIGLYPIRSGQVRIMQQELAALDEPQKQQLSLKMGVLFQNGALLNSITVAENVAIPLEQHTDLPPDVIQDLVRLKLKLVELEHAAHLLPSELSGGMRKRAALARAIALDPPLLFCDEPSAGLDPITMAALDELILNLKHQLGMTIVLITHEVPSIFRLADRIIFLDAGRVVFEGTLQEGLQSGIARIEEFFRKGKGEGMPTRS
ncbi:MAG: ATP-binding cassette domain-containing protein [Calditrichaeota bacterium]|nr:ATP-binding cassette domain-containing protein [Calditrichota bacterium]